MSDQISPPKAAYSIPEFIQATGLGRTSVYEEIKAGRLRAVKCGKRTLIPAAALTAWLSSLSPANAGARA